MNFNRKKMYRALFLEFFWFYKESVKFVSHQSKIKTLLQSIPKSFGFIKEQHRYYKQFIYN